MFFLVFLAFSLFVCSSIKFIHLLFLFVSFVRFRVWFSEFSFAPFFYLFFSLSFDILTLHLSRLRTFAKPFSFLFLPLICLFPRVLSNPLFCEHSLCLSLSFTHQSRPFPNVFLYVVLLSPFFPTTFSLISLAASPSSIYFDRS